MKEKVKKFLKPMMKIYSLVGKDDLTAFNAEKKEMKKEREA